MRVPPFVRDLAVAGLVVVAIGALQAAGPVIPASHTYGFGSNAFGELGRGNASAGEPSSYPVAGGAHFIQMDGGVNASIAINQSGSILTWGRNTPMLGYSIATPQTKPTQVLGIPSAGAVSVSMGGDHALAAFSNGNVYTWGGNASGQLGRAGNPFPALALSGNFVSVSAGDAYSLALRADGEVVGWGLNHLSQLPGSPGSELRVIEGLHNIVAISAGTVHALALDNTGIVYAWGANQVGQAGQGSSPVTTPTPVAALSDVVAIAAGGAFSIALKSDGTVWAWGQGSLLGSNNPTLPNNTPVPTQVRYSNNTPLTDIVAISAGVNFSLALRNDGRWAGWGRNQFGELGLGFKSAGSLTFGAAQLAPPPPQPVTAIASGFSHSLVSIAEPLPKGSFNTSPSIACGTTITTKLSLDGLSVTGLGNADVMLTLDESGSMSSSEFTALKQFAINFVNALDISPTQQGAGSERDQQHPPGPGQYLYRLRLESSRRRARRQPAQRRQPDHRGRHGWPQ